MNSKLIGVLALLGIFVICQADSCDTPTSNQVQSQQEEQALSEESRQIGMPAITNFREKKLMKDLYELRDQTGLVTYTYFYNEMTGKIGDKLCDSIGYPLPGATQFTSPEKMEYYGANAGWVKMPQAEPNGLFMPSDEEATWVMCLNSQTKQADPIYVEPRVITSEFPLK